MGIIKEVCDRRINATCQETFCGYIYSGRIIRNEEWMLLTHCIILASEVAVDDLTCCKVSAYSNSISIIHLRTIPLFESIHFTVCSKRLLIKYELL